MDANLSPDKCFWHLPVAEAYQQFSSGENGLTNKDATKKLLEYSPNTVAAPANNSAVILNLNAIKETFVSKQYHEKKS